MSPTWASQCKPSPTCYSHADPGRCRDEATGEGLNHRSSRNEIFRTASAAESNRRGRTVPKLRDLTPVDSTYALKGPNHNSIRLRIEAPADALFRCLEDGPAWKEWLNIDVEWTSPTPFGIGTTRTVTKSGMRIDEYFLVWEPGRRMNFRFDPVAAFAEDYLIEPLGPDSCELIWSYAFEWGGPLRPIARRIFGVGFAFNCRRSAKRLAALMADSGTRFSQT